MSSNQTPKYIDSRFELQYRKYGGFCGGCGQAVAPFAPGLPEDIKKTACKNESRCTRAFLDTPDKEAP